MPIIEDVERYCEVLAPTPFFEDFEDDELRLLVETCEKKRLAPREALWAVGARGDQAYFLIDGAIEETRRLPPDGQHVEKIDDPGAALGLSHLVKDWKHQSAATALERTELLRLERAAFEELFDAGETAAYRVVDRLAEQLVKEMRDANRRLHEVFGSPAETLRMLRRRVRRA